MFKKQVTGVFLVMILVLSISFRSEAASYNVSSVHDEPTTDENSGYIACMGGNGLEIFTWSIYPYAGTPSDCYMNLEVNYQQMVFHPHCAGEFSYYIWCLYPNGDIKQMTYGLATSATTVSFGTTLYTGWSAYGNFGQIYSDYADSVISVSVNWNEEEGALSRLQSIVDAVNNMSGNVSSRLDSLISKMNDQLAYSASIDTHIKAIEGLLEDANIKLDGIWDEQKESNNWLEKIFNFLEEKDEKDKEAATQQGNQSTADIDNMITDDSAGFVDSLGGLTSSMSYTGTNCSWTFPTVKLPTISGVMDEVTLVESQEIDFTYWVNSIPSGILLLIQSVCTVALIVFCFKELYGAISYALTLKGGGNSE